MVSFQEIIEQIKQKYQPLFDDIKSRGEALSSEADDDSNVGAAVDFKITVTWVDQDVSFDVPTVIMKTKAMSLDLPQITMKTQGISFDVPEVYMKDVVISDNPITGKVIISVPDIRSHRIDISMDIPEFTMGRVDFSIDIPEIYSERINWVVAVPQFTASDWHARVGELQEKGEQLKGEANSLAEKMKGEINQAFQTYYTGAKQVAVSKVYDPYSNAIAAYDSAISNLENNKVDPIKVPTSSGERNLRKERDDLAAQYRQMAEGLNAETKDAA